MSKTSSRSIERVTSRPTPCRPNGRPPTAPNRRITKQPPSPTTPHVLENRARTQNQTPLTTQPVVDTPTQQPSAISAPNTQVQPPITSGNLTNHGLAGSRFATSPLSAREFFHTSSSSDLATCTVFLSNPANLKWLSCDMSVQCLFCHLEKASLVLKASSLSQWGGCKRLS